MAPMLIPGLSHLYPSSVVTAQGVQQSHSNGHPPPPDAALYDLARNQQNDTLQDQPLKTTDQMMESDREEGEVSDGPPADSTTRDSAPGEDDAEAAKLERKRVRKEEKRQKKLEKQRLLEEEAAEAERKERKERKTERRLKKKQMREEQAALAEGQEQSQILPSSVPQLAKASVQTTQKPLPVDLAGERKKAKDFIKQWALNGFTFKQLLEEGLDSHFLEDIYRELNLDTAGAKEPVTSQLSTPKPPRQHQPIAALEKENALVYREKTPLANKPDSNATQISTLVVPLLATIMEDATKMVPSLPAIAPKLAQAATTQSQAAAAINRKEYISRLLAARAKSSAAPDPSLPSTSSTIVVPPSTTSAQLPDLTVPMQTDIEPTSAQNSAVESTEIVQGPVQEPPPISSNVSSIEERAQALKRKAQTELARLRLQALASAKAANGTKPSSPNGGRTTISPVIDLTNEGPGRRTFNRPDSMPVINMLESGSEDGELLEELNLIDQANPPSNRSKEASSAEPTNAATVAFSLSPVPIADSRPVMSLDVVEALPAVNLPPTLLTLLSGQTTPSYLTRKRPVASDFDDDMPPTKLAKRPFGEVPGVVDYQDMVIEASDDDSDPEHVERPSLHRLGSRNGAVFNAFGSAASNEVAADVAAADEAERLRLREEQISEMKRRITELEVKRRAKAALASRPSTPSLPQQRERSSPTMTPRSDTKTSNSADGDALNMQQISKVLARQPMLVQHEQPHDSTISAQPGLSVDGAADLKPTAVSTMPMNTRPTMSSEHDKRHEEIRNRLPLINANFASTQSKMALLRAQMEALQAEMLQEQSEKEKLVQELEEYGVDTEGMPHAQLQAVKDSIIAQEVAEEVGVEPQLEVPMNAVSEQNGVTASDHSQVGTLSDNLIHAATTNASTATPIRPESGTASILPVSASVVSAGSAASDNMSIDDDESESGQIISMPVDSRRTNTAESTFEQMEPGPSADTRPTSASVSVDETVLPAITKTASSTRRSLMSAHPHTRQTVVDTTSVLVADDLEMESDSESDYEPPAAKPIVLSNRPLTRLQHQLLPESLQALHTDDLASKPPPTDLVISQDEPTSPVEPAAPSFFKPYVSPLTNFKAYRYSQNYSKEVPGGLRSATYSHAIHVEKPLCQYETLGGICNDPQCQDQHWRQIVAGDDEILRQLGTYIPGQTKEDRERYVTGLKSLISNLRTTHVTDPEAVASMIIEYRRTFLNDPTRVLNP